MGKLIWTIVVGVLGTAFSVFILTAGIALLVLSEVITAEEIRNWLSRRKRGGKR